MSTQCREWIGVGHENYLMSVQLLKGRAVVKIAESSGLDLR
ncbi:unnamed protein product [Schistosoma mattheei]|uniref:Uncharacterized protein n=1 Tax=Schistosoma mattheei TaxID=31246 RepID=A0A183NWW7_9TREM|nr:unnamed protein product [Schistosoma mattheei]